MQLRTWPISSHLHQTSLVKNRLLLPLIELLFLNSFSEFIVTWRNLNKKLNSVPQMLSSCLILKLTKTTVQVHFACSGHPWNIAIYTMRKKMQPIRIQESHCILDDITPIANFPLCATWIVMATVFSMVWYNIVIQHTLLCHIMEYST